MKKALLIIGSLILCAAVIAALFFFLCPEPTGWEALKLHEHLPKPETADFSIITNKADTLSIVTENVSLEQFAAYKNACIDFGYDREPEEGVITYSACDDAGYFLELAISKNIFYIRLTARK